MIDFTAAVNAAFGAEHGDTGLVMYKSDFTTDVWLDPSASPCFAPPTMLGAGFIAADVA